MERLLLSRAGAVATATLLRPGAPADPGPGVLPTPGLRAAYEALAAGPVTDAGLAALVAEHDGEAGLLRLHMLLRRLSGAGLTQVLVTVDEVPVARLGAVGRGPVALAPAPGLDVEVRMSAHASGRISASTPGFALGGTVWRAPGSSLEVLLGRELAALPAQLALPRTVDGLAALLPGVPEEAVRIAVRMCSAAGLFEAERLSQALWNADDLVFHARTRNPGTVRGYGGTYPGRDVCPPEPAVRAPFTAFAGETVKLAVPDTSMHGPGLFAVLEERRSLREQDADAPIDVDRLGELLYRADRLRGTFTGSDGQELADRPVPSGGSLHELEVYPLVTDCAGVRPGLWHYAADRHELELVAEPGPGTQALVDNARSGALMTADPQVVLLVTARFGRVFWKYETVGYPLILKHVGVLYQTFYLLGEALGLAVCALGGGDAGAFAAASGVDPYVEGTVGELVLGSRPPGAPRVFGPPGEDGRPR
ncbi:SagB family peptide dehydrogenase [Yinghuangia seranimata]|uniref:SagB family peptide dehydrogenase n=1 Tax=Yinghuangia seranimata TaxID=408067 RepID=UPI00248C0D07|nr:SagB family peptide dehydrogenase [Yinghuangia seranimata]MDI2130082.1 SagB family peptide dehydrogenase [Yinghuangia seranimata]